MMRRVLTILLFLLLGAIVNVAVAWACAIRSEPRLVIQRAPFESLTPSYSKLIPETIHREGLFVRVREGVGCRRESVCRLEDASGPLPQVSYAKLEEECVFLECGWPMRSLEGAEVFNRREGIRYTPSWVRHLGVNDVRLIPYRPILHRFIANTLFYTLLLLVPISAIPMARRWMRRRAGRCPACDYDLRGAAHTLCPECGAAVLQPL